MHIRPDTYVYLYVHISVYICSQIQEKKKERQDLENISKRMKSLTWSKCKDISQNIHAIHRC